MRTVGQQMERFDTHYAWSNRLLRVDLSNMRVAVHETSSYLPDYMGARGLATRIAWDEYKEPVEPFCPDNPLMFFPGALTGSSAPYSGRATLCAFSPQAYPHPWFTRSNVGGYVGSELKRAGYDGLIVTGAAETPVRLCIQDDRVRLLPALDLWGLDTMDTLEALEVAEGRGARSLVIGPAGERLSRIATIHTASSSACGQGGFGAVMGAKRLKAISVQGSGQVRLARPETVRSLSQTLVRLLHDDGETGPLDPGNLEQVDRELARQGAGGVRCRACSAGCITPCAPYLQDVPGEVFDRRWSGNWVCVGQMFLGTGSEDAAPKRRVYDWQLARRAAFELNVLSNRYGLNQFDLLVGMVPWLVACQRAGLLSELNGRPMDWASPQFWADFLRSIAYREGVGDALAEGGWAAARRLGLGQELAKARYPAWGFTAHCDGRDGNEVVFPYWLVSALQWLADTRDPFNSGHGYLWAEGVAAEASRLESTSQRDAALERLRAIGQRVYGSVEAVDPLSGYQGKARVGYYQRARSVIKDCLPADAHFPLIYRPSSPDGFWRLPGIDGLGDVEGPDIEYHLFVAGTGTDWTKADFERAAARILSLERALQVRHWARRRSVDEMALPYFEQPEMYQNPFLDRRHRLERDKFGPIMDEFYALHGWAAETGWPTPEGLRDLGLDDVHGPMVSGAARALPAG